MWVRPSGRTCGLKPAPTCFLNGNSCYPRIGIGVLCEETGERMSMIKLQNVVKRYEGKRTVHALRGVSFEIQRGEMVATMGPSGCGKSTLLNIIGGLDRPSEGSVLVDGAELSRLDDNALTRLRREKIGFIFQFFNLLPTLTAIENIALPLHLAGKGKKHATARARELLEIVGLTDRHDHLPDELSGGEQQRVAMARALALSPPLILADEPTGNLDSESGLQVLALFKKLQSQFGATVLMVTHDSTAAGFCDRIVRMQDGSLINEAN
jgi:putative ABC transport system ATP-binding protein